MSWKIEQTDNGTFITGSDSPLIATVHELEHANLLVAAPHLYHACKLLEPYARDVITKFELGETHRYTDAVIEQARHVVAAVEKAEGQNR